MSQSARAEAKQAAAVESQDFLPDQHASTPSSLVTTNWIGLYTIVRKEITRILRIWIQTLVPPVITMTLYFVIFGSLIGQRIGEMGGFPYIAYIAPGLIMMSVITNSFANVVSSFFGAKLQLYLEEMLVAPLAASVIVFGYMLGGMFRGLAVGALVTVVAMTFTRLEVAHPLLAIAAVVLTAAVFALGGLINAVFARKFDDISIVPTFVLAPLTYLGGVFFSITLLAPVWQVVAMANPILYMVNAFRYGILGVSDVPVGLAFGLIVLLLAAMFSLAVYLLSRGIGIRS